ncbi:MAG: helix-turn-helix transcriptional regulator [Propionibacteriaceae bacterium]|jgi:AraC-like DNA-binding protein|nr:helix-turn-helix transcriptional regulator [Propionibacteriaceae bacterium]
MMATRPELVNPAILLTGYRHISREQERQGIEALLRGRMDLFELIAQQESINNTTRLAPQPLRSMKNSMICAITVVCRAVIDSGGIAEHCYALSDYYIYQLELKPDIAAVVQLAKDCLHDYIRLFEDSPVTQYPLPVLRAIRLVRARLYEPLKVRDVAAELNLHPNYLSSLFHREVGQTLSSYIATAKLSVAKSLLRDTTMSVTEIAATLSYPSLSQFSRSYKSKYGLSPTARRQEMA